MLKIVRITIDDLAQALDIRKKVFIEEQGVSEEEEIDSHDIICSHYIAYFNDNAVGTARVRYIDDKAKIERVAVLKAFRSKGIGKLLMLHIINDIKTVKEILLSAQINVIEFYESLGFVAFGDEYLDARIMHRSMQKVL